MIEAVIFDCDGTLVDSERLCFQATVECLAIRGITADPVYLDAEYAGCNLEDMVAEIGAQHGQLLGRECVAEISRREREIARHELQPIDGVHRALEYIRLPRCVASNAPLDKMRFSLGLTGLVGHFGEALFSAYSVQAWKPDPTLFLHAASELGVSATRCVVVEDSLAGATAGLRAGMHTLFYNPRDKAVPEGCIAFSDMHHLPEVLASLSE
ncbi:MAG: HAD-IA family hydrolase [Pseudomonadota bacterium]